MAVLKKFPGKKLNRKEEATGHMRHVSLAFLKGKVKAAKMKRLECVGNTTTPQRKPPQSSAWRHSLLTLHMCRSSPVKPWYARWRTQRRYCLQNHVTKSTVYYIFWNSLLEVLFDIMILFVSCRSAFHLFITMYVFVFFSIFTNRFHC